MSKPNQHYWRRVSFGVLLVVLVLPLFLDRPFQSQSTQSHSQTTLHINYQTCSDCLPGVPRPIQPVSGALLN